MNKKNKSIISIISILFIIVLNIFLTNNIYASSANNVKVNSKENEYNTRTLYRNQYIVNTSELSDPVLANSATGTTNFVHSDGPGNSKFAGFSKDKDTSLDFTSVSSAAYNDSNILYSVYKFNVNFLPGSHISSIGNSALSCMITSPDTNCVVKLPTITPEQDYSSVGWSLNSGDTAGQEAGANYTVTSNPTTLYANAALTTKYNVLYTTEAGSGEGTISGTTEEKVVSGQNPKAEITVYPPMGYELAGWVSSSNVALNDGTIIEAGQVINSADLKSIVVSSDLVLKGRFKNISYKIGECYWKVESNVLTIYSNNGSACLLSEVAPRSLPWNNFIETITSVVVDDNVIANPNSSYLFSNLPNVTSIDLTKLDTTGVINMSHMFEDDKKLRTITFPTNFVTSSTTNLVSMFKGCESLTTLDLTSFDTSNVTNIKEMFSGCSNLETIQVDNNKFNTSNVTDVTNMLKDTSLSDNMINSLQIDVSSVNVDVTFADPEPKVVINSEDGIAKYINITPPENGGSGAYRYEIASIEPPTNKITIEGDKIKVAEDIAPGVYEVKVKVADKVRTEEDISIIYTITVKGNAIETPQMPSLTSDLGENFIYKSTDITLKCTSNSSYSNGEVSQFEFGYTSKASDVPSNWTVAPNGTYLISKDSQEVGTKYYFCREKAVKGDRTSDYSGSSLVRISVSNAPIAFDISNGGTLSGNSILYVKYGYSDVFSSLYGMTPDNYPTASMNGYTFNGFYTSLTGGKKVINPDGTLERNVEGYISNGKWILTESKTLYAQYTKKASPAPTPISYYGSISMLRGYLSKYKVVTLTWSRTPGAAGYQACYKKSSDKSYKCYNNGSLKKVVLNEGTKYDFKISPYIKDNGKYIISPNGKVVSLYTLKKMNSPKVAKKSKKEVRITYTKIKGATGYKVYYSTNKNKGRKLIKTLGATKNSIKFKPKRGKKYYYSVRAYKIDNGKTINAPYSDSKKFKLK